MELSIILVLAGTAAGALSGYSYRKVKAKQEESSADSRIAKMLESAKTEAKEIIFSAKGEALKLSEENKREDKARRHEISELERRLVSKEENLDKKAETLDFKKENIEKEKSEISDIKNSLRELRVKQEEALTKIAKLSADKAKEKLLEMIEKDYKKEIVSYIKKVEADIKEEADEKAKDILSIAIQRIAGDYVAETTVTALSLPNDELKGRIIGKEGRNIQAIERLTGCDIIVDDTPGTIVISGFDPIRRHVAFRALESMLKDGRINPTRIEEAVEKSRKEIDKEIKEAGEQAVYDTKVVGLPSDLVKVLGRLKFRTSYGQNVLQHSVEVSNLAGTIAAELGADVAKSKKAGLLHDIGKAIDREVEGTHTMISRDICKKFGISEDIIHAVEAHHGDIEYKSVEAVLINVADAISGGRPGARRDSLENYIKRLEEIENISNSFNGVDKSYAIQAGREVRVFVNPEKVTDLEAHKLAKGIAEKIEKDLKYPGQIKVNVLRETRVIEYAK